MSQSSINALQQAAEAIRKADALLIGAGAGMGVDSGLPDFRGDTGFWKAYPTLYGRSFAEIANPMWFHRDPSFAWGFYGHRLNLYRNTVPHQGFHILRRWAESKTRGYFIFTSNVDGQFQKAGFDEERILECHGSIHHLQCVAECSDHLWAADQVDLSIDESILHAVSELPRCRRCQGLARPNILMFGDSQWLEHRCMEQSRRYAAWLKLAEQSNLVAIELGAGQAIPTVRFECAQRGKVLIRINLHDAEAHQGAISIALGAMEALQKLDDLI